LRLQGGSSLGSVRVHSLTLSFTLGLPFLARNLVSPCLGCEPKARVVTFLYITIGNILIYQVFDKTINGGWGQLDENIYVIVELEQV